MPEIFPAPRRLPLTSPDWNIAAPSYVYKWCDAGGFEPILYRDVVHGKEEGRYARGPVPVPRVLDLPLPERVAYGCGCAANGALALTYGNDGAAWHTQQTAHMGLRRTWSLAT